MKAKLHLVIQQVSRPLIRIMLRKGISFGEFSHLIRQLYVAIAIEQLEEAGEKSTTARVAIRTGLTRKDVAQLRKADRSHEPQTVTEYVDRGSRVIHGWLNDPEFTKGQKELPLKGEISFESLVQKYSGDMPYRAVLKELEEGKLVAVSNNNVRLIHDAYIPQTDEIAKLQLLGIDVEWLLHTITHNLQENQTTPYFQRKVCYNNLPIDAVHKFREIAAKDSMDLLLQFNDWLRERDQGKRHEQSIHNGHQAGVGIYYFDDLSTPSEKKHDQTHS